MLHILSFAQSRARYRNRYVLTKDLVAERQVGHALHTGTFGPGETAPGVSDFDGHGSKNWSNTNVVAHAGRILSLWEGGPPYELTWGFGTVGEHTFDGGLPGAMCAPEDRPDLGRALLVPLLGRAAVPRLRGRLALEARSAAPSRSTSRGPC